MLDGSISRPLITARRRHKRIAVIEGERVEVEVVGGIPTPIQSHNPSPTRFEEMNSLTSDKWRSNPHSLSPRVPSVASSLPHPLARRCPRPVSPGSSFPPVSPHLAHNHPLPTSPIFPSPLPPNRLYPLLHKNTRDILRTPPSLPAPALSCITSPLA